MLQIFRRKRLGEFSGIPYFYSVVVNGQLNIGIREIISMGTRFLVLAEETGIDRARGGGARYAPQM